MDYDLDSLRDSYSEAFDKLSEAIEKTTEQLREVMMPFIEKMAKVLPVVYSDSFTQSLYKTVATPRQYHLYLHGRYRVRKKWERIFLKRLLRSIEK